MIGYLRGEIREHADGKLLLLVQDSVGYALAVPQSPAYLDFLPGKVVEVFVHTHVREDALDLYGFATKPEKELFLTLLSVTGIGPKGALGILSGMETGQLIQAIIEGDREALTAVPGIGKKTADRVVLELAEPLRKKLESGGFGGLKATSPAPGAKGKASGAPAELRGVFGDAKAALIGLGYREAEVSALLNRVMAESEKPPAKAEELIRAALRQLAI
ncbi:MAG: Holliday junction branch migration protein RuvA [Oligoflexia bacterium]|nr:Holliday junction branch migration protein RuvA [Oligoflexia bacterium]